MGTSECLSANELRDYLLGKLTADRLEAVAAHVEECPDCVDTLVTCEADTDFLLTEIRKPPLEDEYLRERGYRVALERMLAIGRDPSSARPTDAGDAAVGEPDLGQLGQYKLLAKLGEGGMGAVYKALHVKLDKVFALKVLSPNRMKDPQAVARFEREMKTAGKLEHVNIVRASDADEIDGTHFLVMEYVHGLDLSKIVHRIGPLPIADACEIVRQAALGLQHAHEHGLVHRDIKPSNLMTTADGTVKILDLGLALLDERHSPESRSLTSSGQIMGTVDYMAPEQVDNSHQVDIRADIYSLGATLYRLLSGRAPFAGDRHQTLRAKLTALATEDPQPLESLRPDIPADLVALVHRMLAKDAAKRFATPAEVAAAIESHTVGSNLPTRLSSALSKPGRSTAQTPPLPTATANRYSSTMGRTPNRPPVASEPVSQTIPRRLNRRVIVVCAGLGAISLLALAVIITIRRGGLETIVKVPDGSNATIDHDGNVEITLPDAMGPPAETERSDGRVEPIGAPGATEAVNPKDRAEMVWVPAGQFVMGTSEKSAKELMAANPEAEPGGPGRWHHEWFDDEKPQRNVYLDGFWIYRYEVTVAQYSRFCTETGSVMPKAPPWGWQEDHPVVNVTWDDAEAYAEWAGVRLPTEAQWEKAARGTDGRHFPWGPHWDPAKCQCSIGAWAQAGRTAPVGRHPAGVSPFGAHDMAGNVFEWCRDWYVSDYYSIAPARNPPGPSRVETHVTMDRDPNPQTFQRATGVSHVVRGGAWDQSHIGEFTCTNRSWDRLLNSVGFRCAKTIDKPPSPNASLP
jgi:serine/threonine protein kinase/formylglycine-generating enzyme required for sulfatase activity